MTRAHRILVVCAVTSTLLAPWFGFTAAQVPSDWKIDNHRWSGPIAGANVVQIRNLYGDLRVRPADEEEVSLSAMIQRHVDDPLRAEIQTSSEGPTFRVEVLYPESEGIEPDHQPESWSKRRVDMTVFVSAKRQLVIETARGLIEVKGLDRGITARSARGDIVLSTAGPATAQTERGSITVQFSGTVWKIPSELETMTGSIAVTLPKAADAAVTMTTYGELTTDFSLTVDPQTGTARKTARAILGKGESKLFMTSNRGNLKLLRAPF